MNIADKQKSKGSKTRNAKNGGEEDTHGVASGIDEEGDDIIPSRKCIQYTELLVANNVFLIAVEREAERSKTEKMKKCSKQLADQVAADSDDEGKAVCLKLEEHISYQALSG